MVLTGEEAKDGTNQKRVFILQRLTDRREAPRPPWPALGHRRAVSASSCLFSCPVQRRKALAGTKEVMPAAQTFAKSGGRARDRVE